MNELKFVLLDDDSTVTAYVNQLIISTYKKAKVTAFDNGRDALKYIIENDKKINAILIDLEMPDFDGLDVLKGILRQGVSLENKKIAILTGQDFEKYSTKLGFANEITFFNKPLTADKLAMLLPK